MKPNRIVVVIEGGTLQGVWADAPTGLELVLIDQDNIDAGDPDPDPRTADPSLDTLLNDLSKTLP